MRRVPNYLKLFQWKKIDSPLCKRCRKIDTYKHRYWDCIIAKNIWISIENILSNVIKSKIVLKFQNVIGGITLVRKHREKFAYCIILVARWSILNITREILKTLFLLRLW